ncbi:cytochrome P450 family protein [Rhypophila decipiens]
MNATTFDGIPLLGDFSGSRQLVLSLGLSAVILVLISRVLRPAKSLDSPPMLSDWIPRVSNTWLYMTAIDKFMAKTVDALKDETIVGFHLGPKLAYFLRGTENIQTLFRNTPAINVDALMLMGYECMMGMPPEDLDKFRNDKSGRASVPAPGFEQIPEKERYWAGIFELTHKYLGQVNYANMLAKTYQRFMSDWLVRAYDEQLKDQEAQHNGWAEMRLVPFMKDGMARAAMRSLMGERILEIVPDMIDTFWDFDKYMRVILFKPRPKWLFRKVYDTLEGFLAANQRFVEQASKEFDWDSQAAREAEWEPIFGSPFIRELVRWLRQAEFSPRSQGGVMGALGQVALNANAIPVTTWGLMELAQDSELRQAIREEVEQTYTVDPETGTRVIDAQKLVGLPRLQSVSIELMRMRVSMNVTREVVGPGVKLGGYEIAPGSLLQAPSEIPHYDESIWGTEEHPASEFWADRHVKRVESEEVDSKTGKRKQVLQFEMMGRPSDWFPFGGGQGVCPGRYFAKQEIMLTLATFVSRFDFEFVEWLRLDGTTSDRPAKNDGKYAGAAGVPPDRDMRLRWRRIWPSC